MRINQKWLALSLSAALTLGLLSGCGQSGAVAETPVGETVQTLALPSSDSAAPRAPATIDLSSAVTITLSGDTASVEGSGVQTDGAVVTITAGGVYAVSGTLTDGRIIVNAPGKDVTVALNGADITCSYGSPLYIYKAGTATVHLVENTENALTDGTSYTFADSLSSAEDEEPNACLYSKADLVLEGAGSLTVTANYNNAITSKDTLAIYDLTLDVTAANHGINGKDSNTIDSASVTVTCGGDAIRSTNDTDTSLGWVSVSNSTLRLTAGEDGIQAETGVTVSSGDYAITTGGGNTASLEEDANAKGVKAGTELVLTSGTYTMDCADDAFHTNGNLTVSGGVYTVSTGDDGFHADETLTVSGGTMDVLTSYEGLEGSDIAISGGTIRLTASDDGVNAAGGMDGSGFGGRGMENDFAVAGASHTLTISGGDLFVNAGGDGLDSNGSISMTGGTVQVFSTGNNDGALDSDGGLTLEGGTLLACDAGRMTGTPRDPAQCTVSINFGTTLEAGTYVELSGQDQSFVFRLAAPAATLLFSYPDLEQGGTYTVSYGGECTGDSETYGLCSGGTYSGGTELTTLTLTDMLTSYGESAMGGGKGAMGGGPMGDGKIPPDGGPMGEGKAPMEGGRGNRGGFPPEDGAAPRPAPEEQEAPSA